MIKIYFDGACHPVNPNGNLGIGLIILGHKGETVYRYSRAILIGEEGFKQTSNNVAEYLAVIEGLNWISEHNAPINEVEILGDSQLVVKQLNREWNINSGVYANYAIRARKLKEEIEKDQNLSLKIRWIPRDSNTLADDLSTTALKNKGVKIMDFSKFKK